MEERARHELEATVAARRELGAGHDDELVSGFLDRIDRELDRRIEEKLAKRKDGVAPRGPIAGDGAFVITLVSLGVSIPLLGIASGSAFAIVLVLVALVAVNALVWRR